VQRGGINDGGTTSSDHRNLLDFMDASLTKDGRVVVAYADGCLGACNGPSGTPAESATDNYATIAYQTAGNGLFSADDVTAPVLPTPTTAPAAPVLSAKTGVNQVTLSWTEPSDGGSPVTSYTIYRGTTPGADAKLVSLDGPTSYVDSGLSGGSTYYYRVVAHNAVGDSPSSNQVSAKPKGKH
jgi:titin